MSVPPWSGRRVQKARDHMATKLPAQCAADTHAPACPGLLDGTQPWVVGHIKSRAEYPELTWEVTNWRHEARVCSDGTGQAAVIAKARAAVLDQLRAAGVDLGPVFPADSTPGQPPTLPLSLPDGPVQTKQRPRITSTSKAAPVAISREPLELRPELEWDPERLRQYPWLRDLADVPADASPPLAMTPVHPEAVCSYGWSGCTHLNGEADIVTWAEREHGSPLRWWQRLAIVRQHEHREDGTLCWSTVVGSASRRSGKSHRMRALATWRLAHAAVIGEVQAIVHCGNNLAVCRDVQKKAWRWAERKWGRDAVTKGNGKELVENPHDGSSWVVKAEDAAYGFDAGLALADECWDVKPDTITEGLEPMTLERLWAQMDMTSTAHRRARSTMKAKISGCLAEDDGKTLLLLWGARPQDDPGDPAVWRAASPHWTKHRAEMMADKYEKALAGEADPQADDPDPMEAFRAQYLNVWSLSINRVEKGEPIVDRVAWGELVAAGTFDRSTAAAVAIESWFDAGAAVAFAGRLDDGAAVLSVVEVADLAEARTVLDASGYKGKIIAGASLVADPALRGLPVEKGQGAVLPAVLDLSRLLAEAQLAHDGSEILTAQVLGVRTVTGTNGPRLVSHTRADAVKAAAWAAAAARAKPVRRGGSRRMVTARS